VNASASAGASVEVADMSSAELARRISAIIEDAANQGEGDVIDVTPSPATMPIEQAPRRDLFDAQSVALPPPRERARAMALSVVGLAREIRADHDALSFFHDMLSKAVTTIGKELAANA
jgi:hypothetical protein